MARQCTVCAHAGRFEIEKSLVDGASYRHIASQFDVSTTALQRHKREHLASILGANAARGVVTVGTIEASRDDDNRHGEITEYVAARTIGERAHAITVMGELMEMFAGIHRMYRALDEWLRDPDDPSKYSLDPRDTDISVICLERNAMGQPMRKKYPLSDLLLRLTETGHTVEAVEMRHADPRELFLKTLRQTQGQTELLMRVIEKLYSAQERELFEDAVLAIIGEVAPDVRVEIERHLRNELERRTVPGAAVR